MTAQGKPFTPAGFSLSSDKLFDVFDETRIDALKRDWEQFSELKRSVQLRYQETVDVREFEPKIQKLLDDHVVAMPAETIIEVVNINDPDALKAVVEETGVSEASKADRIASATRRAITEKMDEDARLGASEAKARMGHGLRNSETGRNKRKRDFNPSNFGRWIFFISHVYL